MPPLQVASHVFFTAQQLASKFVAVAAAVALEVRWVAEGQLVPVSIMDIQQFVHGTESQHSVLLQVLPEHFLVALSDLSLYPVPQVCAEHTPFALQQLAS